MNSLSGTAFLRYQLPAILCAVAIFISSSIPDLQGPNFGIRYSDKWTHLIVYAIFGLLLARAWYYQAASEYFRHNFFRYAVLSGMVYGILDEIHQYFVPGRFADPLDALADALGVLLGAWLFRRLSGAAVPVR